MSLSDASAGPTHRFSLIYDGADRMADNYDDLLFEAGCDDALVTVRAGQLLVDFAREAPSFQEALLSAIAAIDGCHLPVHLVRVEPIDAVAPARSAEPVAAAAAVPS